MGMAELVAGALASIRGSWGKTIEIRRPTGSGTLTCTIERAVKGRTTFQVDSEFGVLRFESVDWLFKASDLTFDGLPTVPQKGDLVVETIGIDQFTYELSIPGGSGVSQAWGYSDPGRTQFRLHTVLIPNV